jgi:hypothetical protein
MKTAIKSALTAATRVVLWFQIRSVEITIHGQTECLAMVGDPLLHGRITIARHEARRELARLRGRYIATLPPGRRITWELA